MASLGERSISVAIARSRFSLRRSALRWREIFEDDGRRASRPSSSQKYAAATPDVRLALDAFEPLFFNNMTLALDRYFVHSLRMVTGKDGNALNEVELMSDSLRNNDGVLHSNE